MQRRRERKKGMGTMRKTKKLKVKKNTDKEKIARVQTKREERDED